MKTSYIKKLAFVLAAAAIGAAFGQPDIASAENFRIHGSQCWATSNSNNASSAGVGPGSNGTSTGLYCPVPDFNSERKENHSTLNVHVYKAAAGGTTGYSRACVTRWDSNGGACGTTDYMGTWAGNQTLRPSRSQWSSGNRGDFGYVYNLLVGGDRLRGYYIVN
ncbi:MAG: hypothetical protein OXT09_27000 [Myxococcales bacterium]|nr:hypothetical protein [Myxococcales bacterium]